MNKSDTIRIGQWDFGTLCICALRYCHGRRSYMPSLVQKIVGKHIGELEDRDIRILLDDCQFQRTMELYGDECDKVDWLKWEQRVLEEAKRRKGGDTE